MSRRQLTVAASFRFGRRLSMMTLVEPSRPDRRFYETNEDPARVLDRWQAEALLMSTGYTRSEAAAYLEGPDEFPVPVILNTDRSAYRVLTVVEVAELAAFGIEFGGQLVMVGGVVS